MTCDECIALGIPERLCKSDKPNIDVWEEEELLFRRHPFIGDELTLKANKEIATELFEIHDDSYNRSSLSKPEDVLLNDNIKYPADKYIKWGIIQIDVAQLTATAIHQINGDSRVFTLVPIHQPNDCNYSHSEIHCFVDGVKALKKPKSVNTVFRIMLMEMFKVVKEAS